MPDSPSTRLDRYRLLDLLVAVVGLVATSPVLALSWFFAGRASSGSGFFLQERIGRDAVPFEIIKFRTMRASSSGSSVTTSSDERITTVGQLLRRSKFDEVPQLLNVLRGEMSLLGPRPDVPGFADMLSGSQRRVLDCRPGITGPASLVFRDEETLLAQVTDPERFNAEVIFPLKTAINHAWLARGSMGDDLRILVYTVRPPQVQVLVSMVERWDPNIDLSVVFESP